jgi:Bacterial mobilisation protein (MobC)
MKAKLKPNKEDSIKKNVLRVRASNNHLGTLTKRAVAVGMPVSTYLLWRGIKPLGQLKKKKEQQDISRLDYEAYLLILKEFNRQGINLNQIAKALNSDKMHSQSIAHALRDIAAIREANEGILQSLAKPIETRIVYLGEQ